MAYVTTKAKFHIALNGVGMILQGAPDRLAYQQRQVPVYGNRFASGDRDYNDLSQWWYFVQTDWSGGFKDSVSWADDAKYFFSTNIDAYSEVGALKLAKGLASENNFAENISYAGYETIGASSYKYVGTVDAAGGKPKLYRENSGWADIISGFIPTGADLITEAIGHKDLLWILAAGTGTTYTVTSALADGTSPTDHTAAIVTAMGAGWTEVNSAHAAHSDDNVLYVAISSTTDGRFGIVKTADGGTTWTQVVDFAFAGRIYSVWIEGGVLYYLVLRGSVLELRQFTIADSVDIFLSTFKEGYITTTLHAGASRKMLRFFQGKLIITIPGNEIWELDPSTGSLSRLLRRDDYKTTTLAAIAGESSVGLDDTPNSGYFKGCVEHDNKLWWGNLVYDGTRFHNTKKSYEDTANTFAFPLFSNGTLMYWGQINDYSILYKDSGYKGTADKNYILLNNLDKISGVDKLANSFTILFKPLASGQKISVEYFSGELASDSTFTALGNASYAVDGGTIREKTFLFGDAVVYKKLWIKIKLEGGGSDTPTLTDVIMEYLPIPNYKKLWTVNVNCGETYKTLDGSLDERTGRELKNLLEKSWLTKSILDFQDVDYSTTLINGSGCTDSTTTITVDSTVDFPEQGRIKIENEEISYTGKTPTTFTGCTRGYRGTKAVAHADNAVVNNAYKVIVTDFQATVPIANKDKELEYIVTLVLREA